MPLVKSVGKLKIPTIAKTLNFENVHLPRRKKLIFEFFYRNNPGKGNEFGASPRISVSEVSLNVTTKKVGFSVIDDIIDKLRPSKIFKKKSLHYHDTDATKTKRFNSNMRVVSESLHRSLFTNIDDALSNPSKFVYSQSLDETCYRDDEYNYADIKYGGSKISAPGVNVLSGYSELGFEPIVEVFITNPNQIVYNASPKPTPEGQENPGNLTVTAGKPAITNRPPRPSRPLLRR